MLDTHEYEIFPVDPTASWTNPAEAIKYAIASEHYPAFQGQVYVAFYLASSMGQVPDLRSDSSKTPE